MGRGEGGALSELTEGSLRARHGRRPRLARGHEHGWSPQGPARVPSLADGEGEGEAGQAGAVLRGRREPQGRPLQPAGGGLLLLQQQLLGKKAAKVSVLDFYSNRHLCKMTLVISCVWFTIAYSYFTLSLKLRDFGASLYLRQVVPAVMELPARLSCIFLLEQLGRKWSLALSLLQASILSLLLIVLPQELKSLMVLVIMLGEFSLAATVTVFFIYTAELLPTVLRATGLGLVSLASTAGAILSLTITSRVPPILPAFLCSLACALALCFTSLLPETQGQPLCDSLEHFLQTSAPKDVAQDAGSRARQKSQDTLPSEDTASEDVSEEAAKNALFNAQMLKLDPSLLTSSDSEVSQGRPAL